MKRALFASASLFFLILFSLIWSPRLIARGRDGAADGAAVVMPLGIDVLAPRERGAPFALYASLEGMSPTALIGPKGSLPSGDQDAERHFPSPLSFRVTATTIGVNSIDPPARIDTDLDTNALIKSLQFRLRINNGGLKTERIEPVDARLIGVPADVPYGERIYRVVFQMPPLPTSARLVLEVVSPAGELLSKFPVALN